MSSAAALLSRSVAAAQSLLSFSQHARLVSLDLPTDGPPLVVELAEGRESLNALDPFIVDAVCSTAHLELKTLIGAEAGLGVLCADGSTRRWYGLVSQVATQGADGGLARYRLWLSPWPVLLGLREDSFLFQDQTTLETVEALLGDYPLARYALRISDATRAALPRHATRTQYRETDLAFLLRILAADGLSFWIEHEQTGDRSESALRHTLMITDEASDWASGTQATLRYHRLAATESVDAIHGFAALRQLRSNATVRSGWNARVVAALAGAEECAPLSDAIPRLEDHDGGSDPGRAEWSTASAARIARLRLLAHQSDAALFAGQSSVRTLAPGTLFTLTEHPDFGSDLRAAVAGNRGFGSDLADARFKVCSVRHRMSNNLRTGLADAKDFGERGTYSNTFECVPAAVLLVPHAQPAPAAPGLLTALVTGVAGEAATSHREHDVRIQFHFQRGLAPNPGGLTDTGWQQENGTPGNAPGNETSGTWVRVAQALAGPDWGMVFVPRIGSEVLVSFEHGDLDRPLIVGALHNGLDRPPFQAGKDSGVDHAGVISGIHTRVLLPAGAEGNTGYNQLLFDDTASALGAQLASSALASQLNLGALIERNPGTATRGSPRGEGAELATDGWAVLRAGQGLLVSATAQPGTAASQLHASKALEQMQSAADLAQSLSDVATAQGAPGLSMPKDTAALVAMASATVPATGGKVSGAEIPAFSAPILLQETPASAVLASSASIVGYASESMHLVAQDQAHFAAGKTIQLSSGTVTAFFTHAGGVIAVAANGPVSIQAQTDALSLLADQSVSFTSTDGKIEVFAQTKIVLQAGQCAITLEGGDISFAMPGAFSVKGARQSLAGGGAGEMTTVTLPDGRLKIFHEQFVARNALSGLPVPGMAYRIELANGEILTGVTDPKGRTCTVATADAQAVKLFWVAQRDDETDDDEDSEEVC